MLRHGEAEPHGARPDFDRALTERGERQSDNAGRALAALGIEFAVALTSPKVRARDTAKLACAHVSAQPVEHQPLADDFNRDEALTLALGAAEGERVLVVGHEPDFSQVVHDLTGARVDFKKGGVAAIRIDGHTGAELIALLRPRELAAIAGADD